MTVSKKDLSAAKTARSSTCGDVPGQAKKPTMSECPESDSHRLTSRQIAMFTVLVLMSMVLSFIEIAPFRGADWLKYDASGVVAALTAMLFGPWPGVAVALLSWIPHLVTDTVGAAMNIMASAMLALTLGLSYQRGKRGPWGALLGGLGGIACATAVSVCLNFAVTPAFLQISYEDVAALVMPYLLPFNLIKATANTLGAFVTHAALKRATQE